MNKLNRTITVEVTPTAKEIAECFWSMDAEGQCEFFNHLSEVSEGRMPFQLQAVTDEESLTFNGRYIMQLMGDYASPQGE